MPPLRIVALSLLLSPLGQAEEPPAHLGPITGIVTDGDHIYSVSQAGIFREAKRLAKPPFRVMSMAGAPRKNAGPLLLARRRPTGGQRRDRRNRSRQRHLDQAETRRRLGLLRRRVAGRQNRRRRDGGWAGADVRLSQSCNGQRHRSQPPPSRRSRRGVFAGRPMARLRRARRTRAADSRANPRPSRSCSPTTPPASSRSPSRRLEPTRLRLAGRPRATALNRGAFAADVSGSRRAAGRHRFRPSAESALPRLERQRGSSAGHRPATCFGCQAARATGSRCTATKPALCTRSAKRLAKS